MQVGSPPLAFQNKIPAHLSCWLQCMYNDTKEHACLLSPVTSICVCPLIYSPSHGSVCCPSVVWSGNFSPKCRSTRPNITPLFPASEWAMKAWGRDARWIFFFFFLVGSIQPGHYKNAHPHCICCIWGSGGKKSFVPVFVSAPREQNTPISCESFSSQMWHLIGSANEGKFSQHLDAYSSSQGSSLRPSF